MWREWHGQSAGCGVWECCLEGIFEAHQSRCLLRAGLWITVACCLWLGLWSLGTPWDHHQTTLQMCFPMSSLNLPSCYLWSRKSLPPGLCNVSSALVSMWLSLGSLFVIQNKPRSITSSQTSHSQGPMPFNWLLPGSQIPFPPGGLEIEHSISGFSLTSIVFPLIALLLALPACSESLYSTWQTVWSLYLSH